MVCDTSGVFHPACGVFKHNTNPLYIEDGFGKVFEIQVDSSGNITATETTGV